jgi:magnesium chelatase family protein
MREQVYAARAVQAKRFGEKAGGLNGRMTSKQIREHCVLDSDGAATLKEAMEALGLSARAHDRILRVARTIADLDGSDAIRTPHLSEALGYRRFERGLATA